jgi:predicted DNA-binding transcriptional regulator AlpA
MAMTDDLLTVEEAAAALGVSVATMYYRRQSGQAPLAWRRGRRLVYSRSALAAFLAHERETTSVGELR